MYLPAPNPSCIWTWQTQFFPRQPLLAQHLDRDTGGCFEDYFSQGDNLLFALCMSAELLNFEDSWMKLNVVNLHLQIDFVSMGMCSSPLGDKGGIMFDGS